MNKRIKKKHKKCTGSRDYIAQLRKERRVTTSLVRRIELSKAIDKVKKADKIWVDNLRRYKATNPIKYRGAGTPFPFDNAVSFMYPHVYQPTGKPSQFQDVLTVAGLITKLEDQMVTIRRIKPRPGERVR